MEEEIGLLVLRQNFPKVELDGIVSGDVATRDSIHSDRDAAPDDEGGAPHSSIAHEGGAGASGPPLQRHSFQINNQKRKKHVQSTIMRSANRILLDTPAADESDDGADALTSSRRI